MTLQVVADVDTIQHIAHARDATSNGVAPATRGHNCAGSATGHGMNSTIVVSFPRDVGVPEAMADLSADIEKLMRCTATAHAMHCYRAFWPRYLDGGQSWFTGYWQLGLGTPARFSTGASREAPVDNEGFSIWQLCLGTQA